LEFHPSDRRQFLGRRQAIVEALQQTIHCLLANFFGKLFADLVRRNLLIDLDRRCRQPVRRAKLTAAVTSCVNTFAVAGGDPQIHLSKIPLVIVETVPFWCALRVVALPWRVMLPPPSLWICHCGALRAHTKEGRAAIGVRSDFRPVGLAARDSILPDSRSHRATMGYDPIHDPTRNVGARASIECELLTGT